MEEKEKRKELWKAADKLYRWSEFEIGDNINYPPWNTIMLDMKRALEKNKDLK